MREVLREFGLFERGDVLFGVLLFFAIGYALGYWAGAARERRRAAKEFKRIARLLREDD